MMAPGLPDIPTSPALAILEFMPGLKAIIAWRDILPFLNLSIAMITT